MPEKDHCVARGERGLDRVIIVGLAAQVHAYILIPLLQQLLALMFGDDFGAGIAVVCARDSCAGQRQHAQ